MDTACFSDAFFNGYSRIESLPIPKWVNDASGFGVKLRITPWAWPLKAIGGLFSCGKILFGVGEDGELMLKCGGANLQGSRLALGYRQEVGFFIEPDEASLFADGKLVLSVKRGACSRLNDVLDTQALIGLDPAAERINGLFCPAGFTGLIQSVDFIADKQCLLTENKPQRAPLDTAFLRERLSIDADRPKCHYIPPFHWMNEPHAPLWWQGRYHIFYQANPRGPYWGRIQWGHASSPDLIHWKDHPYALIPGKDCIDRGGCWSGSACVLPNGLPILYYTAETAENGQCVTAAIAVNAFDGDDELDHWQKTNRVLATQAEGIPGQFRDPFVFRHGDEYLMLVGSGLRGGGGTALLYASPDGLNWTYQNRLFDGDNTAWPRTGEVWELPVLLPLGSDRFILLVNPWFSQWNPDTSRNIFYWVGRFDGRVFTPLREEPRMLDYGGHFTGPSGMADPTGRSLLFTISQDFRGGAAQASTGWAHNMGMPVSLRWDEEAADAGLWPVREAESLRGALLFETRGETNPSFIAHNPMEMEAVLVPSGRQTIEVLIQGENDGTMAAVLAIDMENGTVFLDRTACGGPAQERDIRSGSLTPAEKLHVRLYMDGCLIEIYLNRQRGFTSRVAQQHAGSMHLCVCNAVAEEMRIWSLHPVWDHAAGKKDIV